MLRVGGGLQLAAERGAVDRGDDQGVGALGDHLVDLLGLGGDVVARVLQLDLVALVLQLLLDGVAVGDPALRGLGRHRDADRQVLRVGATAATELLPCALATTGRQRQRQNGTRGGQAELPAHV